MTFVKNRSWAKRAACRDLDTEIFYPAAPEQEAKALAICATCPVRGECLDQALRDREQYGVWGGTTPEQRRRITRRRAA